MALELQTDVAMYLRPRLQASNERITDPWLSRKAEKPKRRTSEILGSFWIFLSDTNK